MILIDGSKITGGGQVLRYALAFSAYTNKPFTITNIRAKRPKPGLRPQHLEAVKSMQVLTNASVEGARIGSTSISFKPYGFSPKPHVFQIDTAGSVSLLAQTLYLPGLTHKKNTYTINGGTDVRWSPTIDYVRFVIIPALNNFGFASIEVHRRGYYPHGGGSVSLTLGMQKDIKPYFALERGSLLQINCVCHASKDLMSQSICEEIERNLRVLLDDLNTPLKFFNNYSYTRDPGYSVLVYPTFALSHHYVPMGASILSDEVNSPFQAAKAVTEQLKIFLEGEGVIDEHLCDHIIPLMAIYGGEVITQRVSKHIIASIRVAEKFTNAKFHIEGKRISVSKTV